jgi:hypothetical protein
VQDLKTLQYANTLSSKLTTWGTGSLFEAVTNSSSTVFSIAQNGATTTNFAITNLASTLLKTSAQGSVIPAVAGTDYVSGGRDWNVLFGALTPTTTLGILVSASSTIGNGTQTGGHDRRRRNHLRLLSRAAARRQRPDRCQHLGDKLKHGIAGRVLAHLVGLSQRAHGIGRGPSRQKTRGAMDTPRG